MYVETYETSSKWTLFSNMRFIVYVYHRSLCFIINLRW